MKLQKKRISLSLVIALHASLGVAPNATADEVPTRNENTVQVTATRPKWEPLPIYYYRDDGWSSRGSITEYGGGGAMPASPAKEQETDDRKNGCEAQGNPVVLYTGNKVEAELDFASRGEMGLFLQRTYNHQWSATGLFGNHWLSNFDFTLAFSDDENIAWLQRPDGSRLKYLADVGLNRWYEDKAQPVAYLDRNSDGTFTYHNASRGIEIYSHDGYIIRLQNEQGVAWNFTYEGGYLQRVTHSSGRNVQFTWNGDQLVLVTDPAGTTYSYTYTANAFDYGRSRLATATLPGAPTTTVTYHYEDARYPGGLTGKSFNGVRYSTFAYDDQQRAILSEHAGGLERFTFAYNVQSTEQVVPPPAPARPGGLRPLEGTGWCDYRGGAGRFCYPSEVNNQSRMARALSASASAETTKARAVEVSTTVVNPLGRRTTYGYNNGKQVSIAGDASPRCAASYKERTYDENGFPDLVSDFANNVTNFDYSPQGFLMKKVEAVATSAERTTTYEWDTAANRQIKETVAGERETVYTYEGRGNISSITVRNLSSHGVQGQTRTTNYTYTYHTNGLKASVIEDGPLPQDELTYNFNQLGDLISVTNSLGHATTYGDYSGLGEPGRITSVVGGISTITRDARGRLLSRREPAGSGWATSSATYDGTGNLASVTQPNGVATYFSYDAARRLVTEVRSLGDGTYAWTKHSYDAGSNRTRTEVTRTDFPQSTTVNGYVDQVAHAGEWQWYIFGWACTTGSSTPIDVHAYAEGSFIAAGQANLPSEANVAAACGSSGMAHRYQLPISLAQRQQLGGKKITVYGISPQGAAYNKPLGNSGNIGVPVAGALGDVASVSHDGNWNYYVEGWACEIGVPSPIEAHLYLGGVAGTGAGVAVSIANRPSDTNVANACQSPSTAHTYRIPLDWSLRHSHGGRGVYVYGVPTSGQPPKLLAYSGNFTVPPLSRSAELVSFNASNTHIINGEQVTLTAQFRNTGNYVWDGGTYLYWGQGNASEPLAIGASVAPGQIATVHWDVAPYHNGSGAGNYAYVVKMADGYGAWGPQATIVITAENPAVYCPPNAPYCEDPK